MESKRQQKVARLIQKELADIFQADTKEMFESKFITVTNVRISPDLSIAKVYVSFLNEKDKNSALAELEEKRKYIKNELARRIGRQIRFMPELNFYIDDTAEYALHIENLFQKLDIPPADKDYKIENYDLDEEDL